MAVYNLPAELPLESSTYFRGGLKAYVPAISRAGFQVTFARLELPEVLKKAVILHKGELTPDFLYLSRFV